MSFNEIYNNFKNYFETAGVIKKDFYKSNKSLDFKAYAFMIDCHYIITLQSRNKIRLVIHAFLKKELGIV